LRRRSLAFRTLGAYVALSVAANLNLGCSTTHVDSARIPGRTAADTSANLSVAVYGTVSDEHKQRPLAGPVSTRLLRNADGALQVVQDSTSSTWSIDALPPGPYVLQIFPVAPADGSAPKPIEKESFTLRAGEKTTIAVILKDRRGAYWTAMGVGIGVIVVAVVVAIPSPLRDSDGTKVSTEGSSDTSLRDGSSSSSFSSGRRERHHPRVSPVARLDRGDWIKQHSHRPRIARRALPSP
jgi:hypothetical protein